MNGDIPVLFNETQGRPCLEVTTWAEDGTCNLTSTMNAGSSQKGGFDLALIYYSKLTSPELQEWKRNYFS
jgi:hypothetical protein